MTLDYSQSKDEAAQIARAALPLASKFDLPANPINYAVLYEYVSGLNPDLCKALGQYEQTGELCGTLFRDLYHTYIAFSDEHAVEAVREALNALVDSAGHTLKRMDGDSAVFQSHLSSCAEELKQIEPVGQLTKMVDALMKQTEFMRASSSALREELGDARRELDELRDEFKRVRQESLVDPLTNIANRRAFDRCLESATDDYAASQQAAVLLMIDVDYFKEVNDRFGHVVGDAVLRWFAKVLKETIKGTDIPSRYGGEEFAVLLPGTSLSGARIVAENIRRRIAEQPLRVGQHQVGRVTCSIGVAGLAADMDATGWVSLADEALYRAKQTGRDRVCLHGVC